MQVRNKNLEGYREMLARAHVSGPAEKFIRNRLQQFAELAPIPILEKLGQCLVDCCEEILEVDDNDQSI